MKKVFKYFFFGIIFLNFIYFSNFVEAKDIEIHVTKDNEDLIFQTWIGSFTETTNAWYNHFGSFESTFNKKQFRFSSADSNNEYYCKGNYEKDARKNKFVSGYDDLKEITENTVGSYSFIIHNKSFTKYNTKSTTYKYSTTLGSKGRAIGISGENTDVSSIEFKKLTNGYQLIKPVQKDNAPAVNVSNNKFPKEYIDELKNNINKYKAGGSNDDSYWFWISEPLAWKIYAPKVTASLSGVQYESRSIYQEDGNKLKEVPKNVGLKSAYNIYEKLDGYGKSGYIRLFGLTGNENGSDGRNSFINYYDNKLYIPKNVFSPNKVYIRHVNEKGESIGNNDSEILISNNSQKIIKNSDFAANNDKISEFPEYYEINSGETLKVSRLLNLVSKGKYYELIDVKKSTAEDYKNAVTNLKNAQTNNGAKNNGYINVEASNNSSQVTVIEFKYKTQDLPSSPPKGHIIPVSSENKSKNCEMTITPTGTNIKPYLIANKMKLLNLEYGYKEENGKVTYQVYNLDISKLTSGSIANNEGEGNELGAIFGGENDKWTLLNGTSPQKLELTNNVNKSVNKSVDDFIDKYKSKLPTEDNIKNELLSKKTDKGDFSREFTIPKNRYNGLRIPKLIANYTNYSIVKEGSKKDNIIGNSTDKTSNKSKVLVYNPIKVNSVEIKSEGVINHSENKNVSVIQKNANFELIITNANETIYNGVNTYNEYLDRYYLIFDIDIIKTDNTKYEQLYSADSVNTLDPVNVATGSVIKAGTIIELSKDTTTFCAKAGSGNSKDSDIIKQIETKITLIGVSNNMPGDILKKLVLWHEKLNLISNNTYSEYISAGDNSTYKISGDEKEIHILNINYCEEGIEYKKVHKEEIYYGHNMYGDAYYFAKSVKKVTNIGRIYGFKVTDCSDIDYKDVFRTSNNTVNALTGVEYFSGIRELQIYGNSVNELNSTSDNHNINIAGTSAKTILPLGPYKNTNTSYINAPKIGYRISFDLKTSGYYNYTESSDEISGREIHIKPTYYYISKDGTKYIPNINLYYKNSSGKYVNFVGSDYTIYFKPKDGYRSLSNSSSTPDTSIMSDKLEPLNIGTSSEEGFTLNYKMMSTADDNFIQAWYGEFKLPNSTIAVEGNNISKPLTDGYIGVKFDIKCVDSNGTVISYNTENKNLKTEDQINTTQWDYEGYLGLEAAGKPAGNLSIQLEKGTLTVNENDTNPKYSDIKGTVVLFDIDNRAANDFD